MIQPGQGILLIADPFLKDPNFIRTVIFICEHNDEGNLGFVLNKLAEPTMDELLDAYEGYPVPVYYGGPVQMDTIHFLHQCPELIPGGQEVMEGIFWGGDFEIVTNLIKNDALDFGKIRFFLGYSGWGEGQLNEELEEKSWVTAAATSKLVFHKDPDEIWKDSLKHLGGDYEMMINFPIDPQLN